VRLTAGTALPIVITTELMAGLFLLTSSCASGLRSRRSFRSPASNRHGVHAMTEPLLEAVNLTKDLGSGAAKVAALKGVSLALNGGELTC
jgi:hypothetical protein